MDYKDLIKEKFNSLGYTSDPFANKCQSEVKDLCRLPGSSIHSIDETVLEQTTHAASDVLQIAKHFRKSLRSDFDDKIRQSHLRMALFHTFTTLNWAAIIIDRLAEIELSTDYKGWYNALKINSAILQFHGLTTRDAGFDNNDKLAAMLHLSVVMANYHTDPGIMNTMKLVHACAMVWSFMHKHFGKHSPQDVPHLEEFFGHWRLLITIQAMAHNNLKPIRYDKFNHLMAYMSVKSFDEFKELCEVWNSYRTL